MSKNINFLEKYNILGQLCVYYQKLDVEITMFEGEKVRLRSFELSDLEAIMEHWNDLEFRKNTGRALPNSRQNREEFIRNTWKLRQEGRGFFFAIEDKKTKEFLGHVSINLLNTIARSFDLGIFIYNKQNWGKGFGSDAMRLMLKVGFEYLNVHRIELGVYPENERAIKVYKKVGFTEVGRKRQTRFMNGKYRDEIIMDILQEEWFSKEG